MKKILFVVNTEGQLLTASSLIFETFNKFNGYRPYVLQVGKTGTARFKNETNKPLLSDKYVEIDPLKKDIKRDLQEILDTRFEKVFIFLEQLSLNIFLVNHFKKTGSTICLAPDGNKPYYTVDKMALKSRAMQTLLTYKYLFARGLYYFKPYFLSWNYARLRPIDEIWVTYPDKFSNPMHKKVVGFEILPTDAVKSEVIDFFKPDISQELKETEHIIFYTNNILYKQNAYEVEIDAIRKIAKKFPSNKIYLKYHPATPAFQVEQFRALGVSCFSNSVPAELYIASLKNSIIIGFWSTSLMVDNKACKFYWLHQYLVKSGKMIDYINLGNPTNHIIDVDNLDDIKF